MSRVYEDLSKLLNFVEELAELQEPLPFPLSSWVREAKQLLDEIGAS